MFFPENRLPAVLPASPDTELMIEPSIIRTKIAHIQRHPPCETNSEAFGDGWEATHNAELWQTGSDGMYAWRDQADGLFS